RRWIKAIASVGLLTTALAGAAIGGLVLFFGSWEDGVAFMRGETVTVDPPVSDVGEGQPGQKRTFTVLLRNRTDRSISIIGGSSDCSCTATNGLPITIPPSGIASLDVTVKFRGSAGRLRNRFFLYTSDHDLITGRLTGIITEPSK